MSPRTSLSILIVNAHAEEIKLATIGFRGFFSDCRVDVAYSAEEAKTLSANQGLEWSFILIDEACLAGPNATLIEELKRQAANAVVLLQSERSDASAAIQAMQAGADFFLAKQSPAFLSELLFCAREAVDKRELLIAAARSRVRHEQLVEALPALYYELDTEGRFVALGPRSLALLGYEPQELLGAAYTVLVPPDQSGAAHFRFNERRSGARGAQRVPVTLKRKPTPGMPARTIAVEVTARGLYDSHRRFLGTVGMIQDIAAPDAAGGARPAARLEELRARSAHMSALAQELAQPLALLREETTHLIEAIRNARITERLEGLLDQLTAAVTAQERLGRSLQNLPGDLAGETFNSLVTEAVNLLEREDESDIVLELMPGLPPYGGNRTAALDCLKSMILTARRLLRSLGKTGRLLVRTGLLEPPAASAPASLQREASSIVKVELVEVSDDRSSIPQEPAHETTDLANMYGLVAQIGGTLDVSVSSTGPLRMMLLLVLADEAPVATPDQPVQPPAQEEQELPTAVPKLPTGRPSSAATERRAAVRVPTTLPGRVMLESAGWDGTVANLSAGGVCLALSPDFPVVHRQEAEVVLRTAIGVLELRGTAYVRLSPGHDRAGGAIHLIVEFTPPGPAESAILASLIEAAREQSLAFSVEVRVSAERPADGDAASSSEVDEEDRRESVRVLLSLPVRLESDDLPEQNRMTARADNISRQGACLLVKADPQHLRGSVILHFASGKGGGYPGAHEPGVPDSSLPARIVWSEPDYSAPADFRPQQSTPATRIGVRFLPLTPYAERELGRLVRQHLTAAQPPHTLPDDQMIVSIHRECRNARGQAIAVLDDHLKEPLPPDTPVVIIAPGYGETAADYAGLAYYLALHRFRVLRYDHSNHIGLSDGELQNTTLRGIQADLAKVAEFVQHTWPTSRTAVIACDLTARASLKMAAHHAPVDLLVLLNPVIDVGALLMSVHGHDLVADYRYGLRRGIANVLGLNVNLDQFVGDMIAGRFTDLSSTLEDIRILRSPLAIVTSPQKDFSAFPASDLPHAFLTALSTQTRVLSVPSTLAGQSLPPGDPPAAFRQVGEQISSVLNRPLPAAEVTLPVRRALVLQQRLELEQTRVQRNLSQISREAIALAHLQQLPQLANLHDYRKLLDDLYAFLAPLETGATIVDAGMGQSDVTRALLVNHAYRTRQKGAVPDRPPILIGLGRSEDQVSHARHTVQALQRELTSGKSGGVAALPPLTVSWMRTDWSQTLPFASGSVHRIVCNLSLSFVGSPRATLLEWYRVLHPEGRLVFTVFHPDSDLSPLYRRHLRLANQDEFSAQAQPVLHYLGRLREAIRHGILHTFTQRALSSLLRQAGTLSFRVSPIFNGQAFVVIVGKRISSSSI